MAASPPRVVNCPNCGQPVAWVAENPDKPFCSRRCKLIDLGEWASEGYRLPVTDPPDDLESDIPPA